MYSKTNSLGLKKILLGITLITSLQASDILLKSQKDILDTTKESAKQTAKKNQKSWLSDINLNISTSLDEDSTRSDDANINWNQDIFKFGGISYQIEYAKAKEAYDILGVDIQEKALLSSVFELLSDIKITQLEIKQTILNIKNKEITILIKKDAYSAGHVDISELNDAIMDKNALQETLISLKATKSRYINSLKELTDIQHTNIEFPKIDMINKDEYLNRSISLKQLNLDINVKNYTTKITTTDFLPTLKTNLKYGYSEIEKSSNDGEYYNYGLNLSMPLSFSKDSTKEVARLEYLKSKQELRQNKKNIAIEYEDSKIKIQSYKEKKEVALADIELYDSLLDLTVSEYEAGYRAEEDVLTLENTKSIRELDLKINDLNMQKEILILYFNMK